MQPLFGRWCISHIHKLQFVLKHENRSINILLNSLCGRRCIVCFAWLELPKPGESAADFRRRFRPKLTSSVALGFFMLLSAFGVVSTARTCWRLWQYDLPTSHWLLACFAGLCLDGNVKTMLTQTALLAAYEVASKEKLLKDEAQTRLLSPCDDSCRLQRFVSDAGSDRSLMSSVT